MIWATCENILGKWKAILDFFVKTLALSFDSPNAQLLCVAEGIIKLVKAL